MLYTAASFFWGWSRVWLMWGLMWVWMVERRERERKRAPKAAQAVPGGEALSTKMGNVHADHSPEGLVNPAVAWGTLGAHARRQRKGRARHAQ